MKIEVVNKLKNMEFKGTAAIKFPTYTISKSSAFMYSCIYGVRGSGKTNMLFSLLEIERNILLSGENRVYWFSGSKDNKVEKMIEKYPNNFVYIDGLDRKLFDEVLETIKMIVEDWYEKFEAYKILKKLVDAKFNLKVLDTEELKKLEENNFYLDVDWQKFNHQHPPISTICFDDLAANPLIAGSNTKDTRHFYAWSLKHRHRAGGHCNLYILSQYPKSINKSIRSQCNSIFQFSSMSMANLKMMFEEYSAVFKNKLKNYVELLDIIEKREGRNFIYIFYDSGEKFVRINFDEEVKFD